MRSSIWCFAALQMQPIASEVNQMWALRVNFAISPQKAKGTQTFPTHEEKPNFVFVALKSLYSAVLSLAFEIIQFGFNIFSFLCGSIKSRFRGLEFLKIS